MALLYFVFQGNEMKKFLCFYEYVRSSDIIQLHISFIPRFPLALLILNLLLSTFSFLTGTTTAMLQSQHHCTTFHRMLLYSDRKA